jgi:hypothetical protein
MLCLRLESLAPTEESLCWAHSAVGPTAWSVEDGFARRLPQNDSNRPYTLFLRIRYKDRECAEAVPLYVLSFLPRELCAESRSVPCREVRTGIAPVGV